MGRYYWGDIEGKFWFAIQGSDAADRFGCEGIYNKEEYVLEYDFNEDHLPLVEAELTKLEKNLKVHKPLLDEFFKEGRGYNNVDLIPILNVKTEEEVRKILSDYADLRLGIKIRDCIKEQGTCYFDGEG